MCQRASRHHNLLLFIRSRNTGECRTGLDTWSNSCHLAGDCLWWRVLKGWNNIEFQVFCQLFRWIWLPYDWVGLLLPANNGQCWYTCQIAQSDDTIFDLLIFILDLHLHFFVYTSQNRTDPWNNKIQNNFHDCWKLYFFTRLGIQHFKL